MKLQAKYGSTDIYAEGGGAPAVWFIGDDFVIFQSLSMVSLVRRLTRRSDVKVWRSRSSRIICSCLTGKVSRVPSVVVSCVSWWLLSRGQARSRSAGSSIAPLSDWALVWCCPRRISSTCKSVCRARFTQLRQPCRCLTCHITELHRRFTPLWHETIVDFAYSSSGRGLYAWEVLDGTGFYLTRDIGAMFERDEVYKFDQIILYLY